MRNMNIKWVFVLFVSLGTVFVCNTIAYRFDDGTVGRYIFTILIPPMVGGLGAVVFTLWR
jgi:hypothetical protein